MKAARLALSWQFSFSPEHSDRQKERGLGEDILARHRFLQLSNFVFRLIKCATINSCLHFLIFCVTLK
jgi:hypothetical protein